MNNRISALLVVLIWSVLITSVLMTTSDGRTDNSTQSNGGQSNRTESARLVMWRQSTDIEQLDLFYGIGGKENEPDPSIEYKLVDRTTKGTQHKLIVEDDRGQRWVLKSGPEAQPETAATRIVWAAGYHVDADYFVRTVRIKGDKNFVQNNVRFERWEPSDSDLGNWEWDSNPFLGTRELDGLKVLMALLRNWDLKEKNNQIRRINDKGSTLHVYYNSDLGATLGSTGTAWNKFPLFRDLPADEFSSGNAKGKAEKFADGRFVKKVDDGKVVFASRRSSVIKVLRGVSIENAKWMGNLLSRLSDKQLADAFRAGGFSDEEVQVYTLTFRTRIDELVNLTRESDTAKSK